MLFFVLNKQEKRFKIIPNKKKNVAEHNKKKIKDKNFELALEEANKIVSHFKSKSLKDIIVLGPSTCIVPKINNIYQLQIILKYKDTKNIMKELEFINNHYKSNKISVEIDINPIRL